MENLNKGTPVKCDCGKLIAYERSGKIYVLCKRCHREIEVTRLEPRALEPRAVRNA